MDGEGSKGGGESEWREMRYIIWNEGCAWKNSMFRNKYASMRCYLHPFQLIFSVL